MAWGHEEKLADITSTSSRFRVCEVYIVKTQNNFIQISLNKRYRSPFLQHG